MRLAGFAWVIAAVGTAALTSYLVSRASDPCAAESASCPAVAAEAIRALMWPAWAVLLVPGYLLVSRPTPARARAAALFGLVVGPITAAVIIQLGRSAAAGTGWEARGVAFGALLVVPGLLSAVASRDTDQRASRKRLPARHGHTSPGG